MELVPANIVADASRELSEMKDTEVDKIAARFMKEQPDLVSYLMLSYTDLFNEDERDKQLFLGTAVWYIMSCGKLRLPRVTMEKIDSVDEANAHWVESVPDKGGSSTQQIVKESLKDYSQPVIMGFITVGLKNEKNPKIRKKSREIMFLNLKTVIDCLNG
jgi:hypothetical protein